MSQHMATTPNSGAPQQVRVDTGGKTGIFRLLEDHYAVHGLDPAAADGSAFLLLEDGTVAVYRNDLEQGATPLGRPRGPKGSRIGPVYTVEPGGGIAVPTGRILVRFRERELAADHGTDLRRASFAVEEILPYAPHAAWVRPIDGSIGTALRTFETLAKLPGVEHVEPQLLMKSVRR